MKWSTLALCSLLVLALQATASATQSYKWWLSDDVRQELQLSDEASTRIEEIFQGTVPELRSGWRELDVLEKKFDKLVSQNDVTEAEVAHDLEHLEAARGELRTTRTMMLFKMHRELTAEQRAQLKAYNEWRRDERRNRDRDGHGERR